MPHLQPLIHSVFFPVPCEDLEFMDCGSSHCIHPQLGCDGTRHCLNGQDENHCNLGVAPIPNMQQEDGKFNKFFSQESTFRWLKCKRDVTPLLTHWSNISFALTFKPLFYVHMLATCRFCPLHVNLCAWLGQWFFRMDLRLFSQCICVTRRIEYRPAKTAMLWYNVSSCGTMYLGQSQIMKKYQCCLLRT